LKPNRIPEDPQTLGEHLLARRLTLGLLQREVADRLGVTPYTVLNWEKGQTSPALVHYPAIIAFLGFDPARPPETLPGGLKAFRKARGLSISAAARLLGVDPGTWARWEKGLRPQKVHVPIVARLLDG